MIYYATWKAHGTKYTSKMCNTLEDCESEVFGQAYAPSRDIVTFWQQQTNSTD